MCLGHFIFEKEGTTNQISRGATSRGDQIRQTGGGQRLKGGGGWIHDMGGGLGPQERLLTDSEVTAKKKNLLEMEGVLSTLGLEKKNHLRRPLMREMVVISQEVLLGSG